jgi:hypothetical protein
MRKKKYLPPIRSNLGEAVGIFSWERDFLLQVAQDVLNELEHKGDESRAFAVVKRASVALSLDEAGLIFVTHDKNSAWLALRETWSPGERLLGVAPFLRRLYEAKALTDAAVLDDVILHADQGPRGGALGAPLCESKGPWVVYPGADGTAQRQS